MITFDRDICFLDIETLGLDRAAPIWEFAAIRLRDNEIVATEEFFVRHDENYGTGALPPAFADDYRARYDYGAALGTMDASSAIHHITEDAIVAGSNPSFDMDRLDVLLREEFLEGAWHYHPLDIPSMAAGFMAHRKSFVVESKLDWTSSAMSQRVGVDPADFVRHTAMGDVQWCLAQWRAMNGIEVDA